VVTAVGVTGATGDAVVVALLGFMVIVVGAAIGGKTTDIFVVGVSVGIVTEEFVVGVVVVVVVVSIHVIIDSMVVQIRVNHVGMVAISTIDIVAFGEVQQFKSGNRAVALKIFVRAALLYVQLAHTKLTYTASIMAVSFVTVHVMFLSISS
jgi:hypothetical protein